MLHPAFCQELASMHSCPCILTLNHAPRLERSAHSYHYEEELTSMHVHDLRRGMCCSSTLRACALRFEASQLALDRSLVAPKFVPCIAYKLELICKNERHFGQFISGADENGIFSSFRLPVKILLSVECFCGALATGNMCNFPQHRYPPRSATLLT